MLESYIPYFTSRYGADVEFLIVINGSTDKTEAVVTDTVKRIQFREAPVVTGVSPVSARKDAAGDGGYYNAVVRVLVEPDPIGKGGALMVGFRQAQGQLIGFVDADGSTPPEAFHDLVKNIGQAGGIIASRWAKGSQVSPRQPFDRRVASRIFNLMTRVLFGLKLTDTQCGAKLMRRDAIQAILPHLGITQWAFDVDLLFQLRRAGYEIREVPTVWRDVEGSKIQVGKASTEMMLALARLRLIYSPFKWVVGLYDRFLGPWIHPEGTIRDHLLTHSLMLFVGAQFGNICNMFFQVAMVRMLGNSDYGVLSAMLGGLLMLSMPLGALSGAITHFSSHFVATGERDRIKAMMVAVGRDLFVPALLIAALVFVGQTSLRADLKLDSPVPLWIAAIAVSGALFGSLPAGVLVGFQSFEWVALIGNGMSVFRLFLGILFVFVGFGANGALVAHVATGLATAVVSMVICKSMLGRGWGVAPDRPAGFYSYMTGFLVASAAYGVLSMCDLLLVKYYFPPEQAGVFAKAAMVARIVFFLPGPVAAAMFPKVTSTGDSSMATRRTLRKAIVVSGLMVAGITGICLLFPGVMLRVLAHEVQPGQVEILRGMALALAPLTFISLIMNYELAQRRFRIMIPLVMCAAGYLLGVMRWHETLLQVVGVLGTMSVAALLGSLLTMRGRRK